MELLSTVSKRHLHSFPVPVEKSICGPHPRTCDWQQGLLGSSFPGEAHAPLALGMLWRASVSLSLRHMDLPLELRKYCLGCTLSYSNSRYHVNSQTDSHSHTHTDSYMKTHIGTQRLTHSHIQTYTHRHTDSHSHTYRLIHTYTHRLTLTHSDLHSQTYTDTHTQIHTQTQSHIQTHTQTQKDSHQIHTHRLTH